MSRVNTFRLVFMRPFDRELIKFKNFYRKCTLYTVEEYCTGMTQAYCVLDINRTHDIAFHQTETKIN